MSDLVVLGLAGAAGAVCRHLLDVALRRTVAGPSPGVLVANVIGSLVLGAFVGWSTQNVVDRELRLAITVGFCGAFTTFSTVMVELVALLEGDDAAPSAGPALGWALATVVGGVGAAAVGWTVGGGW